MRVLSGPAGSGKTSLILEECRGVLRAGNPRACLLVPTATMAQHLRNQLAREGFVFRNGLVQTLDSFLEPWVQDVKQVSMAGFYLVVEQAARQVAPGAFAEVAGMPGFSAALARTMEEFSSAGCDAVRLAAALPDAPLAPPFLAIYQEVEKVLASRKLATRARRLQLAAEKIRLAGAGDLKTVWLDGFHSLPDPELEVIAALNRHTQVTLSLNPGDCSATLARRLAAIGFEEKRMHRVRTNPALLLIEAANIEREVEEIAHRILEQAAAGRPFREMGIIVRAQETYRPILRSTMERFGIPARFYFEEPLEDCAPVRFLTRAVDAMLSGWDHAATLAAMRLAPRLANSSTFDSFDFQAREKLPNQGLDDLRALARDAAHIQAVLTGFEEIETWRGRKHTPKEWLAKFATLRSLYKFAPPEEGGGHLDALVYRAQAAALDGFDEALEEAAAALSSHAIAVEDFWRTVKSALRIKGVRVADRRRNVVQVMSAAEARQWVLPVVFVCGMAEKQFPQTHRQDAFFPDVARQSLHANGVRLRTAAEFDREEWALFESAISRATSSTVLSYPEVDGRGEGNSPSTFLDGLTLARVEARAVRPRRRFEAGPRPEAAIQAPALLRYLGERSVRLSPSGLEYFLQCAFKYFGSRTLKLKAAPYRPDERFDFLLQGVIAHDVLAKWFPDPQQDVEELFEASFAREREGKKILENYRTERLRNTILDDLLAFTSNPGFAPHGQSTDTEKEFKFALEESAVLAGRIDRIDREPDGAINIYDYKYSPAAATKSKVNDETLLQGPLYALAAETQFGMKPDGVYYISLKGAARYKPVRAGWSVAPDDKNTLPMPPNWAETARLRSLQVLVQIREGTIEPKPANPANCRYCDFLDVCRTTAVIDAAEELAAGEGA